MGTPFARSLRSLQAKELSGSNRLLWASALLLVIWIGGFFCSSLEIVVVARGSLRPLQAPVPVMSSSEARVLEVKVREGQTVAKGQLLLVLQSRASAQNLADLGRSQAGVVEARRALREDLPLREGELSSRARAQGQAIASWSLLIQQLGAERDGLRREYASQQRFLRLGQEQYQARFREARLQKEQSRTTLENAQKELDAYRLLSDKNLVAQLDVLPFQEKCQQARTAEGTASEALLRARTDIERSRQEQAKLAAGLQRELSALERRAEEARVELNKASGELAALDQQRLLVRRQAETQLKVATSEETRARASSAPDRSEQNGQTFAPDQAGRIEVRSPIPGRVSELRTRSSGGVVQPRDLLCSLVPNDSKLVFEGYVANRDMTRLAPDQKVRLKLDAFPFEQYGYLEGEVRDLAADSTMKEGVGQGFRVEISLRTQSLRGRTFRPGLDATAEILTGPEPIVALLLRRMREGGEQWERPAR